MSRAAYALIGVALTVFILFGTVASLSPESLPETIRASNKETVAPTSTATAVVTIAKGIFERVVPESDWKSARATVFWVGEGETSDNGYISNVASAWDGRWEEHFGGLDDPDDRCGYAPCAFTPLENPFYIALPYSDLDDFGNRKDSVADIPWSAENGARSLLKNRWIEVRVGGVSCFGQWQDVGPFEEDDFQYVFGDAKPANSSGVGAGIDLSPALRDCLHIDDVADVTWRHVAFEDVPRGPWLDVITIRK